MSAPFSLDDRPKLRWPLDFDHLDYQGQRLIRLSDAERVAPEPIVLPAVLTQLLTLMDGTRTVRDIADETAALGVTPDLVFRLADELNAAFFLETPLTTSKLLKIHADFAAEPIRKAAFAGTIYPSDPALLADTLNDYIAHADRRVETSRQLDTAAIISPHIDYRRGWQGYGSAFSALRQSETPDVVFLIGTSHKAIESYFQLTEKDFDTPFGAIPNARTLVASFAERYGRERLFKDEYLHKSEHSLELQLPFLYHAFRDRKIPSIVPILIGSFHTAVSAGRAPYEISEVGEFISLLGETVAALRGAGNRVMLFGGVDLAHVGLHFGDRSRVSDHGLEELRRRDEQLLETILQSDEQRLFEHIAEDGDARRICGFPSIYVMLRALRLAGVKLTGNFIDYRQAVDKQSDCVVTFGSAYWTDSSTER